MLGDWIDDLIGYGLDNQEPVDTSILKKKFPQLSDDSLAAQAAGVIDRTRRGESRDKALSIYQDLAKVQSMPTVKTAPEPDPITAMLRKRREIKEKLKTPNADVMLDQEWLKNQKTVYGVDEKVMDKLDGLPQHEGVSYNLKQYLDDVKNGDDVNAEKRFRGYKWQGEFFGKLREAYNDGKINKDTYKAKAAQVNAYANGIGAEDVAPERKMEGLAAHKDVHARLRADNQKYTDGRFNGELDRSFLAGYAENWDSKNYESTGKYNEPQAIAREYLSVTDPNKLKMYDEIISKHDPKSPDYDANLGYEKVSRDLENLGLQAMSDNVSQKLMPLYLRVKNNEPLTPEETNKFNDLSEKMAGINDEFSRQRFKYNHLGLLDARVAAREITGKDQKNLLQKIAYSFQSPVEGLANTGSALWGKIVDNDEEAIQRKAATIGQAISENSLYGLSKGQDMFTRDDVQITDPILANAITKAGSDQDKVAKLMFDFPQGWSYKAGEGVFNLTGQAVLATSANAIAQMGGFMIAGAEGKLAQIATGAFMEFGSAYQNALVDGKGKPMERALLSALMTAPLEGITDEVDNLKKIFGAKVMKGVLNDETFKMLSAADQNRFGRIFSKATEVGKEVLIQTPKETIEEVGQEFSGNVANGRPLSEGLLQAATMATIGTLGFSTLGSAVHYNKVSEMQRTVLYNAGARPDASISLINEQLATGKITKVEADKRRKVVEDMSKIVKRADALRVDGSEMEEKQVINYAYNQYVKGRLKEIDVPPHLKEQYDNLNKDIDTDTERLTEAEAPVNMADIDGKDLDHNSLGDIRKVLGTELKDHEREVLVDVAVASKSLEGTGIKFRVFTDGKKFADSYEEATGDKPDEKTTAAFDGDGKTVFVNLTAVKNDANWNAVWHEGTHPVLNIIRNTNPKAYEQLVEGIKEVGGFEAGQGVRFGQKNYAGKSQEVQDDESVTEFLGNVSKGYINLDDIPTSLKQRAINIFNGAMEVLGSDYKLDDTKGQKFVDAARQISAVLTGQSKLSDLVGEENLGAFNLGAQKKQGTDLVEASGRRKDMTEDNEDNYVFYHYSDQDLRKKQIDPSKFGNNTNMTGRDEKPMQNISMFYTRPDIKEQGVSNKFGHVVRIPKNKVYPFNKDPMNFLPKAEELFRQKYPTIAFDLNKQVAYVTKVASENGYPMTVADWQVGKTKALRAQSVEKLKPEMFEEATGLNSVKTNPELDFKPNAKRKDIPKLQDRKSSLTRADITTDKIKGIGKKGEWAILTGTKEKDESGNDLKWDDPKNIAANKKLFNKLRKDFGKENVVKVSGFYKGNAQGQSFMVLNMPEAKAREIGMEYGQESVLTRSGNVFSDGSGVEPSTGKIIVGEKALQQEGYSITEDGTPFSLDIKWGEKESSIAGDTKALVEINPNFIGNAKKFANEASYANKLDFKRGLQARLEAFMKDLREVYGKDFDPSKMDYKTKQYVSRVLTEEAKAAIREHPESIGWYDEKTRNALAIMSLLHPELATDINAKAAFITALAITSNGNKVDENFQYANEQYIKWRDEGMFEEDGEFGIQQSGIKKSFAMVNEIVKRVGMAGLNEFFLNKHRAGDLKYKHAGKLKDLISGENADEEVFGASILGSKIGNGFYMNLWGEFGQLTMDRWFMRTWGRITGTLVKVDPEKVSKSKERFENALAAIKSDPEALAKLKSVVKSISGKNVDTLSREIQKASAKKPLRKILQNNSLTDEIRMASNNYQGNVTGEIEAPSSGGMRKFIRETFVEIQKNLKLEGIDITMADLQAVLWYPEKILYESFKDEESFEQAAGGYTSGEAPDYQNAATKLVKQQGVSDEQIQNVLGGRGRDSSNTDRGNAVNSGGDIHENRQRVINAVRESRGQLRRADIDGALFYADKDGESILDLPHTNNKIVITSAGRGYTVNAYDQDDNIISPESPIVKRKEVYDVIKDLSWKHGMPTRERANIQNRKTTFYASNEDVNTQLSNTPFDKERNDRLIKKFISKDGGEYIVDASRLPIIKVYDSKLKQVGVAVFDDSKAYGKNGYFSGYESRESIKVNKTYRRKGIATALIDHAENVFGVPYRPSSVLSPDMEGFVSNRFDKSSNPDIKDGETVKKGDPIFGDVEAADDMVPAKDGSQFRVSLYQRNALKDNWDRLSKSRGLLPKAVFDAQRKMDSKIAAQIVEIDMLTTAMKQEAKKIWGKPWLKAMDDTAAQTINDALTDPDKLAALPDGIRQVVQDMRNRIDGLSQDLITMGIADGAMAMVVDRNLGTYMNRTYRKYFDKDWHKHIPESIRDRAEQYIRDNSFREDPATGMRRKLTDEEVEGEMNSLVNANKEARIIGGTKLGSKDTSNLKSRFVYDQEVDTIVATPTANGWRVEGFKGFDKMVDRELTPDVLDKAVGKETADKIRGNGQLFGGQYQGTANNKWIVISEEIPEEIRDLMGEYKDPTINFANTAIKLSQLIARQEFLNSVKDELGGKYFFKEKVGKFTVPITGVDSKSMNPLDDVRFTSPEIAEAFQGAIQMQGEDMNTNMVRVWAFLNGLAKAAKTVLSPTSQVRNIIGGVIMNMMNARSVVGKGKGFRTAFKMVGDKGFNDPEFRTYVKELVQLGVMDESPDLGEIRDIIKRLNAGDNPVRHFTSKNFMNTLAGDNKIGEIYRASDNWMRIWGYESELATLQELKPNMSLDEQKKLAAEIVRDTYPTFSMAPQWVRALSRNVAISSFPTFTAEMVRTTFGTFQRGINEMKDPDLRSVGVQRVAHAITMMAMPAILMAVSKAINGYDDKDEQDIATMAPEFLKDNSKFYLHRSANGNPNFIDMSSSDPTGYLKKPFVGAMRAYREDGLAAAVAEFFENAADPFTSAELFTKKMWEGIRSLEDTDSKGDMAWKFAGKLKEAFEPAAVTASRKIIAGATNTPIEGKMYDPKKESIAMFSGQRYYEIDPVLTNFFVVKNFIKYKNAKAAEYNLSILKKKDAAAIDKEYNDSYVEIETEYNKMKESVNAAKRQMAKGGQSVNEIRKTLIEQMKDLKLNKEVRNAVINDQKFPKNAFKRKEEDPND